MKWKITPLKGNVAIKSVDGRYLKVTGDGLAFADQNYDPSAKFTVEIAGPNQTVLSGSNAKYVRIYESSNFDIRCDAMNNSDAVTLGTLYLADGLINLTITQQVSLSDRTIFLSSQAGTKSYGPSLRALDFEDVTCRFIVEYL
ncbi:hypothetical protein SERLA73DRAFT_178457 [Serpula lacrymans var. lacrymans S7.3]|uniref:Fascin domain-containing protein n=2 Tax=Serpula lacrymans var. lacrymans TaxID=341189 RepID=F8PRN3_SERL3|nr:uncharacterized protein SERLADRAFT_462907 [Serpula lacrymans var. lacrymans S7.9]EGO00603.1 hypothetical protein SERLA73DRAFT_178457 [Serpula lacrymans var. lacrymans S7.3]EGO26157.1 hypothetical protein SERLADRAFT_462907 [Serpula lacrymans var. lacrymans S7.9]